MNDLGTLKIQVEQLRNESRIKREKLSVTLLDMKNFIVQHQDSDHLLKGFKKKEHNPFKSKEVCNLV
ncbi:guanine nucleotide-binding subunit gamma-1 [Brachionus plicatilis]|uniref:Guanine nucleotide-binding subunit gamma-1 n=1 Tax=Brachionus plicatilis TaxID=10195 RepID=A0A3M7RJR9_BRAPC|nr:guanine nucleotide-binding subunit gamma-1 [Brachionus plicatilis]